MNKTIAGLAAAMCLGTAVNVSADARFYGEVALAFGGDEVADVLVETWDGDIESVEIDSGEGLVLGLGTRFDFGASNFDGVVAVGYKSAGILGEDGDEVGFDRYPLSAMIFYDFGPLQLGAGLTREMNGRVDLKDAGGRRHDVEDTTGQTLVLLWEITDAISLGARYTTIDYEIEDYVEELDGDNLAIVAAFSF